MKDKIMTWQQGRFMDGSGYRSWSEKDKKAADGREKLQVRPAALANSICLCKEPDDAAWIAKRLNRAAQLEQLLVDYASGKRDTLPVFDMARKIIKGRERNELQ
jgi:hypothetical protein